MRIRRHTSAPAVLAAAAAAWIVAAVPLSAQEEENFTMERTPEGFVRLDNRTGAMALCEMAGEQLVCRMAVEDRHALEEELDALKDRVAALEQRVGSGQQGAELPSDEELERTMGIMETFMRRFFDIVEDLNRDFRSEPEAPADDPTRT